MPVTIVVGGQYGSEGKGKVVALLARSRQVSCVVRCGGPNSGHSTEANGEEVILRQLPSSVGVSDSIVAIAAGAVIDEQVLLEEVAKTKIEQKRLIIDPRAAVVQDEDREREVSLSESIASTGSGNGQAIARRLLRENAKLAVNSPILSQCARIEPVAPLLHELLENGGEIIVEGTQGFGLSLLHSPHFPYVTSKDTTAAAFAMEVGLSPRQIDEIVMVVRTFPIRVGGASGPLSGEITWKTVQELSGAASLEEEFTSVTRKLRRVATFDHDLVRQACRYNKPTSLAVMGLDRLDIRNRGAMSLTDLTPAANHLLSRLRLELGVPIHWIGTGFGSREAFSIEDAMVKEVANVR